jgi:hypothetical protein
LLQSLQSANSRERTTEIIKTRNPIIETDAGISIWKIVYGIIARPIVQIWNVWLAQSLALGKLTYWLDEFEWFPILR